MTTAALLRTIAIISAWSRHDEEALQILIKGAGAHLVADLIEFNLLILTQNTEGNPRAYLDFLSEQCLSLQDQEADQ